MLKRFLLRWVLSGLGLWVAAAILGPNHLSVGHHFATVAWAGFFLAIVNILLKPITILLSLPAIVITLGLFMIIVNGLMILVASKIYHPLFVSGLWSATLAGVIVGLVNYLATRTLEDIRK